MINCKTFKWVSSILIVTMLLLISFVTHSSIASAQADINHVQDEADILTDEEEAHLRDECAYVGEAQEIDLIILTTDHTSDSRKVYLEDFYDIHYPQITDAVLILVDMDPNNRGVEIQAYGQCEFSISDDRIERILDQIVPYLSDGAYYDAFHNYIDLVDNYMSMEATSDYVHTEEDNEKYVEDNIYYPEDYTQSEAYKKEIFKQKTLFNLLIGAVVGAVSVGIMLINSKGKITVNSNTYRDPKNTRLLGHWDRYIRTTTTRTRKPENNNNHGGGGGFGGGGISAGGHSHSGGGRGF